MNLFALNLFLAVAWATITGTFSLSGLVAGFVLGYLVLWITRPLYADARYFLRVWKALSLFAFFVVELVHSSFRVAHDVLTPRIHARPGIVAVPLDARTDAEITLLAGLISLTPGSLALDVSADRRTLFVHVMFMEDPDAARDEIKRGMERRLLEVMR
ncbi:MAG TPA: Na+/H+ antiporter subunit E [Myxococcota bacterium]|jgi:multicomponent Na+:H+ antiporter subunit E|nr:Na+/H+ antiporter subunit E [Myxococcota bacterium]